MKKIISIILGFYGLLLCNPTLAKNIEVIARITPPYTDIYGIAVSKNSRIFNSCIKNNNNNKINTITEYKEGKLLPLNYHKINLMDKSNNTTQLNYLYGITIDGLDRLWMIENGGKENCPYNENAKLICVDINNNKIIHYIEINKPVINQNSKLINLRIDLKHGEKGTAYITNSSYGKTPSLIVVDIANLKYREVLVNHESTKAKEGFMSFVENKPIVYNAGKIEMPAGGINGIALVENANKIYWTNLTGRELYSISTDIISDFTKSDAEIQNSVKYEGERPACDAFTEDNEGNLYFGAYEQKAIVKRTPDGKYLNLAIDENLSWITGLTYSNGFIYATLGQWNRASVFNNGKDLRIPPFLIIKVMADK